LSHMLAAALIAAFFLQSFSSSLIKSPSSDEPPHIASGLAYVQKHNFVPNAQHPPLLKEMAAASLLLAGVRLPDTPLVNAMLNEYPGKGLEWRVGNGVIAWAGPARVMFWARLPLIVLSTLLGLVIYLWGRRMLGQTAALGALVLFALDPNLVAHSQFVTTDMGAAAFMTLFFFCLWSYLRRPGVLRLAMTGFVMGLFLCAKFSAVVMMPVALLLMLTQAIQGEGTAWPKTGKRLALAAARFAAMSGVAALVIMGIYFSPSGLADYVHGMGSVYADFSADYLGYMAGQTQSRFLSYFVVAWLLKEPLATLAAVIAGSVYMIRSGRFAGQDKLFLLLPPVVLFVACTIWAENIGVRYVLPAFPFLYLAGGAGIAGLLRSRSKWGIGLTASLCVWLGIAAVGIYPDHLSYFNEAACLLHDPGKVGWDGGTRCGPWWLDDSNTDWGQGLEQLRSWMKLHPDSRTIRMGFFGSFPPSGYGLVTQGFEANRFDIEPQPGLYVLSAKFVSRGDIPWIKTTVPTAIVGHALYVYDIRSRE
jgi:hypothetical protein